MIPPLTQAERERIRSYGRVQALDRMTDLFKQGFWPWNKPVKAHTGRERKTKARKVP